MPAPKGHCFNKKGRPGAKGKKTLQWEIFSEYMLGGGLEKFQRELNSLEGTKFVNSMIDLMEFFKPKLARVVDKNGDDIVNRTVIEFDQIQKIAKEIVNDRTN